MKSKIVKKILAGLLLASTISTVSGSVLAIPPKNAGDFVKEMMQTVENDCYESSSVASKISDMAKKHLLNELSSEQIMEIVKILSVCSKHTIYAEMEAQENKCGFFSNMSYINATQRGFSNGDAARSSVQDAIGSMINDGLFDKFEPDQIVNVVAVLESCLYCEIYGAKSNLQIAKNIKSMAKRGLFNSLTEVEFGCILDVLYKCVADGEVEQCFVYIAVNSILELKAKCLTPEVKSRCENILEKCKNSYNKYKGCPFCKF